jgi:Tfp pilus assembly protein PilN
MRPVNLIPPEDRRGDHAPLRSGPLAYILLGALVAVLAGVTALVLTGNQVVERESEVAKLERDDARAVAKAERLVAYTEFRSMSEQRVATVQSLADSRFDWERVMRELSLVLPRDAWLTALTASASSGTSGGGGGGSGLRAAAAGPALELSGCASGQEAVAGFVTALKDIDGVTRVGVQSSELGEEAAGGGGEGSGSGGGEECRTRKFIAKFEIVVAFDAAPIPLSASAEGAPAAPVAAETEGSGEGSEASSDSGEEGEGG